MDCEKVKNLLSLYHEGLLSPDECAELKNHLASCPSCSRVEAEMRSVHNELAGFFGPRRLPADFNLKVLQAISTPESDALHKRRHLAAWASIAAAAVLGFTLILFGLTSEQTTQPVTPEDITARETSSQSDAENRNIRPPRETVAETQSGDASKGVRITIPPQLLKGKPVTEGDLPGEQLVERPAASEPDQGEKSEGHGKAGTSDNGILASPREAGDQKRGEKTPPQRKPLVNRNGPVRPRRQAEPGSQGESDERRRRRQELAERSREGGDAGRLPNAEEFKKLSPEERRKVAAAIKECTEKGIEAPWALRVAGTVLRNGGDADDVRLALNALARAVNRGIPAARFAAGLERALNSAPEGADLERILKKLGESLGNSGGRKTN